MEPEAGRGALLIAAPFTSRSRLARAPSSSQVELATLCVVLGYGLFVLVDLAVGNLADPWWRKDDTQPTQVGVVYGSVLADQLVRKSACRCRTTPLHRPSSARPSIGSGRSSAPHSTARAAWRLALASGARLRPLQR